MESEGSLPCFEQLSTSPHPEPDNPMQIILVFFFKCGFTLRSHLCLGHPSKLSPSDLHKKGTNTLTRLHHVCCMP